MIHPDGWICSETIFRVGTDNPKTEIILTLLGDVNIPPKTWVEGLNIWFLGPIKRNLLPICPLLVPYDLFLSQPSWNFWLMFSSSHKKTFYQVYLVNVNGLQRHTQGKIISFHKIFTHIKYFEYFLSPKLSGNMSNSSWFVKTIGSWIRI